MGSSVRCVQVKRWRWLSKKKHLRLDLYKQTAFGFKLFVGARSATTWILRRSRLQNYRYHSSSICRESATGSELWLDSLEHWHRGNFGHYQFITADKPHSGIPWSHFLCRRVYPLWSPSVTYRPQFWTWLFSQFYEVRKALHPSQDFGLVFKFVPLA